MALNSPWHNLSFDEEFERFLKQQKGRGDYEEIYYKHRYLNKNYTSQLIRTRTQQVVIKIINKGTTSSHLRTLIGYVSRTLEYQKEEQESIIFNQNNEELSQNDFELLIEDWSSNFEKVETTKETNDILEKIDFIEQNLEEKRLVSSLSEKENEVYSALKQGFDTDSNDKKNVKITLAKNKNTNEIGIVRNDKFEENKLFYPIDYAPHVFRQIVPKESLSRLVEYERKIPEAKVKRPKNFSHIVLSPGGDNPDPKATLEATKQFLEENFKAKGHDYLYTLHKDTKNTHVHVILNNYSKQTEYKFSPNKYDLHHYRTEYKNHLNDYGIDRTAVVQYDRKDFIKNIEKDSKNFIDFDKNWYQHNLSKNTGNSKIDLLAFRKQSLKTISFLSDQLEKNGNKELAKKVKDQKKEFEKVEEKDIDSLLNNTKKMVDREQEHFKKFFKREIDLTIGHPSKFYKDEFKQEEIIENMTEKYISHMEKTKENLEDVLDSNKYSKEIEKRAEKSIKYIEIQIIRANRSLGRDLDFERDFSR